MMLRSLALALVIILVGCRPFGGLGLIWPGRLCSWWVSPGPGGWASGLSQTKPILGLIEGLQLPAEDFVDNFLNLFLNLSISQVCFTG